MCVERAHKWNGPCIDVSGRSRRHQRHAMVASFSSAKGGGGSAPAPTRRARRLAEQLHGYESPGRLTAWSGFSVPPKGCSHITARIANELRIEIAIRA